MAYMRESNSLRFHQLVALVATPSLVAPTSLRSVAVCQMFDPDNGPSPHPAGKLTLEISQIKVIEADLPNVGWHEHKERQYRIVVKIGQQRIKSKESEKSKRPKWNETYPFVDIDSTATFHLQLSVKTSLRRVPVADISETVQSILPSSRSSDASYIVTRDLASCPGAKLEFCVKVINADSFSLTTAVVLAEAANAVESLPAYHPLEIPTMRPSSPVVDTAQSFGQLLLPLIENVKPFCDLMAAVSKVHPYAQIVWSLLDGVYSAIKNQVTRDGNIRELLRKMDSFYQVVNEHNEQIKSMKIPTIKSPIEFLQRVCAQTIECCFFIRSYASPGFMERMLESAVSNVDARITAYCDAFESLKQSFYEERQLNTELAVVRVLGAVQRLEIKADLNDMLYSRGSALDDEDKACLEGTREDMLNIATKWANCDLSPENPWTILLLLGEAGTGKSAIAHSMAQRFKKLGRLGSSFGFVRNTPDRHVTYLFPTIARNMADFDEDIKQALWKAVGHDTALRTTSSLKQQFENFLRKPFDDMTISGPVLIVIDALDECGDLTSGKALATLLATCAKDLPSNFRLFITSRPEYHIHDQFKDNDHVLIEHMNAISVESTSNDIGRFIRSRLINCGLEDLDECCKRLVIRSQGLFQWASVACHLIVNPAPSLSARGQYNRLDGLVSDGGQENPLDSLYTDILERLFRKNQPETTVPRFKSVLEVVLTSFEPLSMTAIKALHETLKQPNENYDAKDVLQHLGSLLSGVTDTNIPIRPLHTSFRDFLTELNRSKDFFVGIAQAHQSLVHASLRVMNKELKFNICKLESSYMLNDEIPDLQKRIDENIPSHLSYSCRFWARHLDIASTNGRIANPDVRRLLKAFVDENILFWLEVLSILGGVSPASPALETTAQVLKLDKSQPSNDNLIGCINDIQTFVDVFARPMSQSAPHIYISAVPFSPRGSWISKQYLPRLSQTPRVCNPPEHWPTSQGVIHHSDVIWDIAISTDGARIAGACGESGVFIWDTRTGLLNSGLSNCGGSALDVAFSADGARVAYALKEGTIGVWDVESGRNWTIAESIFDPKSYDEVRCLTLSPDGKKLIAGSWHGTVGIWDTSSGDASGAILYQSIMKCSFTCISFLSHGGALACGYKEKTIEVWKWDATTLQLTEQPLHIEAESSITAVGVSFDGRHVAAGLENDTICLWGLPEGTPIGISVSVSSRTVEGRVWWIAFTQDGSHFASAGSSSAVDVWEITPTGPVLEVSLQGHTNRVRGLAYSPDGRHLFSCSDDRTIRKWDAHSTNTPDPIIPQSTSSIVGVYISHDGTRIASVSWDGTVRLWDGASGTAIGSPSRLSTRFNVCTIYHSAMSRDGTRIMTVSWGMVWLLDFKGCKQTERRIELHTDNKFTGVSSADGSRIYITSGDRIYTIDVDTMEETPDSFTWKVFPVKEFYGPPVISPDGAQFAVLSLDTDETVRLRIIDSQTVEEVSLPMLQPTSALDSWCISPDFHYIAWRPFPGNNIQVVRIEGGIFQKDYLLNLDNTVCRCLVFLPYTTATLLASAHWSDIVIWDLVSCKPIIGPLRHSNSTADVVSMACLQDGKRLVAGYEDGKVLVWDVSVFDDSHSGNSVIPIVLSPEAAHALPHPEDILSPEVAAPKVHRGNPINTVEMTEDGWMVGPKSRRLFWVPPELRARILPHMMKWDLTGGEERIQLDLSQFAHGPGWTDCYVDSDVFSL